MVFSFEFDLDNIYWWMVNFRLSLSWDAVWNFDQISICAKQHLTWTSMHAQVQFVVVAFHCCLLCLRYRYRSHRNQYKFHHWAYLLLKFNDWPCPRPLPIIGLTHLTSYLIFLRHLCCPLPQSVELQLWILDLGYLPIYLHAAQVLQF